MATRKSAAQKTGGEPATKAEALKTHKAANAAAAEKPKAAGRSKKQVNVEAENAPQEHSHYLANQFFDETLSKQFKGARRAVVVASFVAGYEACKQQFAIPIIAHNG